MLVKRRIGSTGSSTVVNKLEFGWSLASSWKLYPRGVAYDSKRKEEAPRRRRNLKASFSHRPSAPHRRRRGSSPKTSFGKETPAGARPLAKLILRFTFRRSIHFRLSHFKYYVFLALNRSKSINDASTIRPCFSPLPKRDLNRQNPVTSRSSFRTHQKNRLSIWKHPWSFEPLGTTKFQDDVRKEQEKPLTSGWHKNGKRLVKRTKALGITRRKKNQLYFSGRIINFLE